MEFNFNSNGRANIQLVDPKDTAAFRKQQEIPQSAPRQGLGQDLSSYRPGEETAQRHSERELRAIRLPSSGTQPQSQARRRRWRYTR